MIEGSWEIRGHSLPKRELTALAAAMALGLAIRLAYVIATHGHALAGDEPEYDIYGRLAAKGHWFWSIMHVLPSSADFGKVHPSLWKAPGYPAWVGLWYSILGPHPDRVLAIQTLLGPVTIGLTWLLGRRLFGSRVAIAAALVVAVYPLAWQYETRLFSESLATPFMLLVLLCVLDRPPTPRRAAAVGALMGLALLVRPTFVLLFAGIAVAWWVAGGLRRGTAMLAITVAVSALVVAPWTYRNHHVAGGFVLISLQDAALYGVFNDDAAHDPIYPWAWRPLPSRDRDLFARRHALSERELRSRLIHRSWDYIRAHPGSVPKAFFWNGLSRLWDVRRPARAVNEVKFEGRTKAVMATGLAMYYVLLPLCLLGLWRARRRIAIVAPVLAIALAASIAFTTGSGTRYRAPFEPLIVILACSALPRLARAGEGRGGPGARPT